MVKEASRESLKYIDRFLGDLEKRKERIGSVGYRKDDPPGFQERAKALRKITKRLVALRDSNSYQALFKNLNSLVSELISCAENNEYFQKIEMPSTPGEQTDVRKLLTEQLFKPEPTVPETTFQHLEGGLQNDFPTPISGNAAIRKGLDVPINAIWLGVELGGIVSSAISLVSLIVHVMTDKHAGDWLTYHSPSFPRTGLRWKVPVLKTKVVDPRLVDLCFCLELEVARGNPSPSNAAIARALLKDPRSQLVCEYFKAKEININDAIVRRLRSVRQKQKKLFTTSIIKQVESELARIESGESSVIQTGLIHYNNSN